VGWRVGEWVTLLDHPFLLTNVQSLENKPDDLHSRLSYQWDIKNGNILCFTELWLNDDMDNIQLAGFSVHRQDRTATSGKTRGGGMCLFVKNSRCTMSNIKEALSIACLR
jgi:ribosome assembly protein 1